MNAIAHDILKQNDTDLLKPHQVEGFRHYLVSQKCNTRKGNGKGQFLFVETSAGWAALQRGAGGTVKSPIALRAVIQDYLKSPAARCVSLAGRISQAALVPVEAPDLAERVAEAVAKPALTAVPGTSNQADWPWENGAPGQNTGEGSSRTYEPSTATFDARQPHQNREQSPSAVVLPLGVQPVSGGRAAQWRGFSKLAESVDQELRQCTGPTVILPPRLREMAAKGTLAIIEAPATVDLQHLEDLRDDFAIHCPLPQLEGEDLGDYADRRWAYADLMISKRFPMDADK